MRRTPFLAFAFASLVACDDSVAETPVASRPQRHQTDDAGRSLIFRGINIMSRAKSTPDRQPDITEAEIAYMSNEAGFRFSRHLIFWSAIEPSPGVYDEAYLDRVEQFLDLYAAHDVKVLLDMHQDIFGHDPAQTWGNGAPAWAIELALDGVIPELPPQSVWSFAYFLPEVKQAFDRFFGYEGQYRQLQDHYADAWAHVAERFRDHPAVVGYDLMNEPSPGSAWDPAELGISDFEGTPSFAFDRDKLGPFYQRVIDRIRTVDEDTWLYYEPRYGAPGNGARSYLPMLRDPRAGDDRLVYAPHMYSVAFEARGYHSPTDDSLSRYENARNYEIREANVPLVVGEFGLEQSWPGGLYLTELEVDAFDRMNASWAYWSFDPGTTEGSGWTPFYRTGDPAAPLADNPNADVLVRVYPLATAGYLRSFEWNRSTRVFTLRFDTIEGVTGVVPTEIFVPDERFYPDGFSVVFGEDDITATSSSFDDARNVVTANVDVNRPTHLISIVPNDAP